MRLALEIPDTAPIAELNQQYLKEALVVTLYHLGKLSEREACEALGMTRRAFHELLPRFGFSILGDDPHTIETELDA
jgi:predicted HTH domain antitoxin